MTSNRPIRIILVDDHRHVHKAVSTILDTVEDIDLVAQGSNGLEAIELCQEHQPDLVLIDVVMPAMDGVQATQTIRDKFPEVKLLVLSSFQDHESVRTMLESGASGYVIKGSLSHDLVSTIRATHQGQAVFSAEIAQQLLNAQEKVTIQSHDLTDRELEVLGLMAEGLNNGQIGHELSISRSTVKFHINNILYKMKVDTRAEALVSAAKGNLI